MARGLGSPSYESLLLVVRGALGLSLVWLLLLGDATAALIAGAFLGLSFVHLLRGGSRAGAFDVLFALAAVMGTLGYVFGLFDEVVP